MNTYVIPFERLGMHDVETVGGKNASLGEMIGSLANLGVRVPGGFATTAQAYRDFLKQGGLNERIRKELATLNVDDVSALAATGARIRGVPGRNGADQSTLRWPRAASGHWSMPVSWSGFDLC